jgi:hypothetical protein
MPAIARAAPDGGEKPRYQPSRREIASLEAAITARESRAPSLNLKPGSPTQFTVLPISFASMLLPLSVNAVLRAMTKLPGMRESAVVRFSVMPSAK